MSLVPEEFCPFERQRDYRFQLPLSFLNKNFLEVFLE